jgi:hypothetical protein
MNKRIKELAFESKLRASILLHHYGNIDALTDSEQESLKQMENFARLIVRECAEVVEGFVLTEEVSLDEYVDYEASDVLKKHFGVQE